MSQANQRIYFNGDIVTMVNESDCPKAVLTQNGKIVQLGDLEQLKLKAPDAKLIDLKGKTMLPGFVDPHSHIYALAQSLSMANVVECTSISEVIDILKRIHKPPGEWIIGINFDNAKYPGNKVPTKEDLDQVSTTSPVLCSHISGHMGVVNSYALKLLEITADSPDPPGGKIRRKDDGKEPTGLLEESAFFSVQRFMKPKSPDALVSDLEEAQKVYVSFGITTAQDGRTLSSDFQIIEKASKSKKLFIDVICYPEYFLNDGAIDDNMQPYKNKYVNRLKVGGYKIFLDGSPQGRTAWMSKPYLNNDPSDPNYCGYPVKNDDEILKSIDGSISNNMQLLAHCNGDAAADQYIRCCSKRSDKIASIKPVMIHSQLLRRDQVPQLKHLNIISSFFVAHTFYWGDIHLSNFGPERANYISPVNTAYKNGIKFTLHQDTPVILPNMLETIWCAVNRITRNGVELDRGECVSPFVALKGVTEYAAHQYSEDDMKGTIEPGKLADFVILDKNPLKVPKMEIKNIKVLETIKEDVTVFTVNK